MSELILSGDFSNSGLGVGLTVFSTGDDILFLALEVSKVLGYRDSGDMLKYLEEDDIKSLKSLGPEVDTGLNIINNLNPNTKFITEAGLYDSMIYSKKKETKPFKRWITHEVLPSIRKTGSYSVVAKQLEDTTKLLETSNQSLDLGRQYYRDLNSKFKKLEYNHRMLDFKVKGYGNRLTIRRYLGLNGMSCYNLEYELIYDPRPIVQFLQQKTYKDRDWSMDYASPESKKLSVHFTPHVLCFYHDDIMFMAQELKEQALAKAQKGSL